MPTKASPTARRMPRYARKQAPVRREQLIEAAIRCLGEGGMSAFTIDRICREAAVSRGLINHHFGSKDELLACVYETMTDYLVQSPKAALERADLSPGDRLRGMIEATFAEDTFDKSKLRVWLALWGQVSTNQRLHAIHQARYRQYRARLARAIEQVASDRKRDVDANRLATTLIALIDGLWLEWCLAPNLLTHGDAKIACYNLIEPCVGSICQLSDGD